MWFLRRGSVWGKPSGDGESITDWWFRCQSLLELGQLGRSLEEQPDPWSEQLARWSLVVSFRLESWGLVCEQCLREQSGQWELVG